MSDTAIFLNSSDSSDSLELLNESTNTSTEQDYIRLLVERATTPFEKLGKEYRQGQQIDKENLENYLSRWARVLSSKGDRGRLQRFLQFSQLSHKELQQIFAPAKLNTDSILPQWAQMLQKVHSIDFEAGDPISKMEGHLPVPLEPLVLPFIKVFRSHLQKECGDAYTIFTDEAHRKIERFVMALISRTMGEVLFKEFNLYMAQELGAEGLANKSKDLPDDHYYRKFIQTLQADRLSQFWHKYPVLARITGLTLYQHIQSFVKLLNRLHKDLSRFKGFFELTEAPGRVVDVSLGLSDPHKGGEGVMILRFETGWKVVYKPREMEMGLAYNHFCEWINEKLTPQLKILKILDGKDYGWIEYAAYTDCQDEAALHRYYERAGMILGITYLLGSTDFHAENLIANGEHPVLVDFETLLQPPYPGGTQKKQHKERSAKEEEKVQLYKNSVMRAALLPMTWNSIGVANDSISGFGGITPSTTLYKAIECENRNTDRMALVQVSKIHKAGDNIPKLNGQLQRLPKYRASLKLGFKKFYELLLKEKSNLHAETGPLSAFKDLDLRFIFRNTNVYVSILNGLKKSKYLSSATEFGLRLELLERAFIKYEEMPDFWSILAFERQAMLNQDVPFFLVKSNAYDLRNGTGKQCVENYFQTTSLDFVSDRLMSMNDAEMERQLKVIDLSIDGYFN